MKANELAIKFIQRHGFDGAKTIIESIGPEMTNVTNDGRMFVNENSQNLESHVVKQLSELVVISEVKRLVESWELVKSVGGIDEAYKLLWNPEFEHTKEYVIALEKAISDVESVGVKA